MTLPTVLTAEELLEAVFSDEPAPDIHAAVVVAHAGDECLGASWLLSRLCDRASVFRLTPGAHALSSDAVALTGLPAERCQDLGLESGTLARDLEALTWLVAAAVQGLAPRLLVTHAWEGINLDHDAVAFAVQMTALLLPRFGSVPPVLLEFQCHHESPEAVRVARSTPVWERGVRVDFGADSQRLKQEILQSREIPSHPIPRAALRAEIYRPHEARSHVHGSKLSEHCYQDAEWCTARDFRANAVIAARSFAAAGLIASAIG